MADPGSRKRLAARSELLKAALGYAHMVWRGGFSGLGRRRGGLPQTGD